MKLLYLGHNVLVLLDLSNDTGYELGIYLATRSELFSDEDVNRFCDSLREYEPPAAKREDTQPYVRLRRWRTS